MTKTKKYPLADALRVKAELDEMPEREPEEISLREALILLSPEIHALRRKNYGWEDIVALLDKNGIHVSVSVLKKRVGEHRDAKLAKGDRRSAAKDAAPSRRAATTTARSVLTPASPLVKGADVPPDAEAAEGATRGGPTTASLEATVRPGNRPATRPAGPPPPRATGTAGESTPGTPAAPGGDVPKTARQPSVGAAHGAAEDLSRDAPGAGGGTVRPQAVIAVAPTAAPKEDGTGGAGRPKGSS